MTPKTQQPLHPYSVKIETPTGKSATLPVTLLTPKQAEEVQVEFKRLAHEAGVKGARINVQRLTADDYEKIIHEAGSLMYPCFADSRTTNNSSGFWPHSLGAIKTRTEKALIKHFFFMAAQSRRLLWLTLSRGCAEKARCPRFMTLSAVCTKS